jgi:hypothetical protein
MTSRGAGEVQGAPYSKIDSSRAHTGNTGSISVNYTGVTIAWYCIWQIIS